jgi:small subunit ribosomal protein S8
MSQDTIADALNMIKNAKRAGKENVEIKIFSNLLIEILKMMKQNGAIKKYKIDTKKKILKVSPGDLSECKAIKPRFSVDKTQLEKYQRRYLPARNVGTMIISTSKGLMTHEEATEKNIGGCLIAYYY